jgi:carbonic anhydrase
MLSTEGQPLVSAVQLGGGSGAVQVVAVPQQFHMHAHSEHLMAGVGCTRVSGCFFCFFLAVFLFFFFAPPVCRCSHARSGRLYPLEVHLVSVVSRAVAPACPPSGCLLVTAVMFELADDISQDNPWLEPLFEAMPLSEGVSMDG